MNGGKVYSLFGGNYNSNLTGNTSIDVKGGIISNIYGGSGTNTGSVSGNSVITVDNATVTDTIFGGGVADSVSNTTVNIKGGNINQVYGGCGGPVNENATVNVSGGTISAVFGGGVNGAVKGNAAVNVSGGTINFMNAGGSAANVLGDATINITGGNILNYIQKKMLGTNSKCNLYISGGNVYDNILDGLIPVVSATNNTPVKQYTLTVGALGSGQAVSKLVTAVPTLGYSYGMNGVETNASSQIKVYLPDGKTQAAVKVGSTYYKGNITANTATLDSYTTTTITATPDHALTSATGTVRIDLDSAITDLSTGDIVVSNDGVALTSGKDYVVSNITTTKPTITFAASAGLDSSSVVTVAIEKMNYDISSSPVRGQYQPMTSLLTFQGTLSVLC